MFPEFLPSSWLPGLLGAPVWGPWRPTGELGRLRPAWGQAGSQGQSGAGISLPSAHSHTRSVFPPTHSPRRPPIPRGCPGQLGNPRARRGPQGQLGSGALLASGDSQHLHLWRKEDDGVGTSVSRGRQPATPAGPGRPAASRPRLQWRPDSQAQNFIRSACGFPAAVHAHSL